MTTYQLSRASFAFARASNSRISSEELWENSGRIGAGSNAVTVVILLSCHAALGTLIAIWHYFGYTASQMYI